MNKPEEVSAPNTPDEPQVTQVEANAGEPPAPNIYYAHAETATASGAV